MNVASWKQFEHRSYRSSQRFSLKATIRNKLRMGERAYRLIKGIALILIAAVAVGIVVSATLALVGTDLS